MRKRLLAPRAFVDRVPQTMKAVPAASEFFRNVRRLRFGMFVIF
jgi:hypothetical protein